MWNVGESNDREEVAVNGLHVETTKRVMGASMMDQCTAVGEDEEYGGRYSILYT